MTKVGGYTGHDLKRTSELLIESERVFGTIEVWNEKGLRPFFWQVGTRSYYYDKELDEIVMLEKIW